MSKSPAEIEREYRARMLAEETMANAQGDSTNQSGGTYLTTSFRRRDDLPVTASLRKMSDTVVRKLAELGLREPVSLRELPGRRWRVNVDAAELGLISEFGGGYVTRMMSSERLMNSGFEVVDGPFRKWENVEVTQAILRKYPSKYWDARISDRPLLPVIEKGEPFGSYDDAYTSEALLSALDQSKALTIFSGPFNTAEEAHYALDLRWESPE